jgi:hypothetical protein
VARGIFVPLPDVPREVLYELAEREDRDPRVQAARFIREGLELAGALTDTTRQTTAPAGPGEAA